MDKLRDCIFCNSEASLSEGWNGEDELNETWVISCSNCPCEMVGDRNDKPSELFPDEKEVIINAWNNI